MNPIEIMKFMCGMGWYLPKAQLRIAYLYLEAMLGEQRVIQFSDVNGVQAILIFSVCSDPQPFLVKQSWDYLPHDPDAESIVIEHFFCKVFSREFKRQIEEFFSENFPQFKDAYWARFKRGKNKFVHAKRSAHHEKV